MATTGVKVLGPTSTTPRADAGEALPDLRPAGVAWPGNAPPGLVHGNHRATSHVSAPVRWNLLGSRPGGLR